MFSDEISGVILIVSGCALLAFGLVQLFKGPRR